MSSGMIRIFQMKLRKQVDPFLNSTLKIMKKARAIESLRKEPCQNHFENLIFHEIKLCNYVRYYLKHLE